MSAQSVNEELFQVFSKYSPQGIHHCDCGCIDEEDVKRLATQPLHSLDWEALGPYHGSALYTWGDITHYKHYLPRILVLYSSNRRGALIDLYDIYAKLKYADWLKWDAAEIEAIQNYLQADWLDLLHHQKEINLYLFETYRQFLSAQELINLWSPSTSETALKNYVYFFYETGTQIFSSSLKSITKGDQALLTSFFKNSVSIDKLEHHYFEQEAIDAEYATKVSVVLQMLEQENALA
ncbi:hypothetical protein [Lewinella cohaerens]|uniref:hypothetical protein n=1 Tax=Lewinella cohaerens TaxID=70995 RepID=UPI000381C950|nr:hypothetical protein [Lewinella cohaerens]